MPASGQEVSAEQEDRKRRKGSGEIVVTGRSLVTEKTTPLPVQILSGDELVHRRQGGLGETLAGLPGIHLDNFGGGASRPVIRGQTLPRIEVLTDGANLFDASSVSPDHAITTDPLLLDAIEIQRGPSTVRYGGNALNGAINLIDSKVPKAVPNGGLTGATEVRFSTGDEEKTVVGRVTAGLGSFALHAEGSRRVTEDYNVPSAYGSNELRDSFAKSSSYSVGASWITSKGYIGAAYTRQDSEYGLPGHSHKNAPCHTHDLDLHCGTHGATNPFAESDDSHTAQIALRSERVDVRADYDRLLPGLEHARLRLSYTDYMHDEVDGPFLFSRYANQVYDGRLELTHLPVLGFSGTFGVQYTDGLFSGLNVNNAYRGFGDSYDFKTENVGVFLTERRAFGPVDVEIGVRQDWRTMGAVKKHWTEYYIFPPGYVLTPELEETYKQGYDSYFARHYPPTKHDPFSASLGATWNISAGYSLGLTLARSQRAPSVRELYARGNNLATSSYEVGLARTHSVSSLLPAPTTHVEETTKSMDLTFRKIGGRTEFEVGMFYQDVNDYIFARLIEEDRETGVPHRLLVYTAADARFFGIDGQISHRFSPESRVTIFGDYVDAELRSENDNLPRIPPGRLGARYEHTSGPVRGDVEYYHTFEQDQFASYETPTPGYDMVNATLAYRLDLGRPKGVEFYVRGTNLTNQLAYAHTSFVKDQSPLRGRSVAVGMRHSF
jgi:iron complex outermembrane receptor protein